MPLAAQVVRFGPFELNVRAAELRSNGNRTKLAEQPFQVLTALLEKPGEVVTREELRQRLWGTDTFVDFEHGLNTAVKRLREILGDSAENPRFIETLPRHGYRLIVPLETSKPTAAVAAYAARRWRLWVTVAALLVVGVAAGLVWRQRKANRLREVHVESLAVLPLENLSGNAEEEYFAEGMTEALITELGKVHALRVISRHSVMQYKGTTKTVPQIAKELNVDAVVEGSAVRAGGKVRITTQLILANPERHLWSESYERSLSDIIALQSEVTQAIAREVRVKLTPQERANLGPAVPRNPDAYNAYLLGRFYSNELSEDSPQRAIASYQRALQLDDTYAPAWAMLADALATQALDARPREYRRAREAAERALLLDPDLAEGHVAMAQIKMWRDWDWAAADGHLKRALALAPGNTWAVRRAAQLARALGHMDEAMALGRRSIDLNPLSPPAYLNFAVSAAHAGHLGEAIAAIDHAQQLHRADFPGFHYGRAGLHLLQSRPQEALAEAAREPVASMRLRQQAVAYFQLGRKNESDAALRQLIQTSESDPDAAFFIASVYAFRGEAHPAMDWLERAYAEHQTILFDQLKSAPAFKKIAHDPRYRNLLQRLNLPE